MSGSTVDTNCALNSATHCVRAKWGTKKKLLLSLIVWCSESKCIRWKKVNWSFNESHKWRSPKTKLVGSTYTFSQAWTFIRTSNLMANEYFNSEDRLLRSERAPRTLKPIKSSIDHLNYHFENWPNRQPTNWLSTVRIRKPKKQLLFWSVSKTI